jgi:hypothetical protein
LKDKFTDIRQIVDVSHGASCLNSFGLGTTMMTFTKNKSHEHYLDHFRNCNYHPKLVGDDERGDQQNGQQSKNVLVCARCTAANNRTVGLLFHQTSKKVLVFYP